MFKNLKKQLEAVKLKREISKLLKNHGEIQLSKLRNMTTLSSFCKHISIATYNQYPQIGRIFEKKVVVKEYKDIDELINEVKVMDYIWNNINIERPEIYGILKVDIPKNKYLNYALVMEYVDTFDLMDLIDKNTLNKSQRIQVIQQLVKYIDELHKFNVTHNDIKCDNTLVLIKGNKITVTLIDFAVSSLPSNDNKLHWLIGTRNYYSPEMYYEHKCLAKANDVWSLGVVIYILISKGYCPFDYCQYEHITNSKDFYMCIPYRLSYCKFNEDMVAIFQRIFVPERIRITIQELCKVILPVMDKILSEIRLSRVNSDKIIMTPHRRIFKNKSN
jgi:serine/threonine protein kinase